LGASKELAMRYKFLPNFNEHKQTSEKFRSTTAVQKQTPLALGELLSTSKNLPLKITSYQNGRLESHEKRPPEADAYIWASLRPS
jgi:hypothetical protein